MEFMVNSGSGRRATEDRTAFLATGQSFLKLESPRIQQILGIKVERSPTKAHKSNVVQYVPIERINFKYDEVGSKPQILPVHVVQNSTNKTSMQMPKNAEITKRTQGNSHLIPLKEQ